MEMIKVQLKLIGQEYPIIANAYAVSVQAWGILVYWETIPIGMKNNPSPYTKDTIENVDITFE